jgi:hypothetical protein
MDDDQGEDTASSHETAATPDPAPLDLERKVDIIAGAVAELEGRVAQMAGELTSIGPKLNELLDRHPAGLGAASETTAAVAADVATTALEPVHTGLAALDAATAGTREEVLRTHEAIDRVATAVAQLEQKTDDRLAAVRDAAMAPVSDLQAMLAARGERLDRGLEELAGAVQALRDDASDDGRAALLDAVEEVGASLRTLDAAVTHSDVRPVTERVDELAAAVQSLTWQLPELTAEVASLRAALAAPIDEPLDRGADDWAGDDVVEQITGRMETALAGLLRLIDERLASVRMAVSAAAPGAALPPPGSVGGFEAGAVMGAAQAAWNRLEQRLDNEFDDLSRQLQAMAAMIEQATASAEAAANRPVVTGEQLRHAASSVKDSVLKVSRARRDRRGGPRGLNPGS